MDDSYTLATPEQVDLTYDVAGLGSRFLALLVDSLVQVAMLIALVVAGIAVAGLSGAASSWRFRPGDAGSVGTLLLALMFLVVFLLNWGYFIFFEMAWNGQTPGKRALGLRVMTTGGQPITLTHALIRNLVRIVDLLPTSYLIGAVAILVSPRCQRLGDLAAGTLVVKVRPEARPEVLPPLTVAPLSPLEAARFGPDDVALARDFLLRRTTLSSDRRGELGGRLAERFRSRLDRSDPVEPAEVLLQRVAALRR
jgi:uncharacterized RDD family membrane protein YckC